MCPISLEMMENPVITTAGLTYERACIEEWFRKGNSTDPMAHVPVMKILTPNIALKQQIAAFKANFELFTQQQQQQRDQRDLQREQEDSNLAMQLRIEELTRSMQSKMQRLDHMQTRIEEHDESITALTISLDTLKVRSTHTYTVCRTWYTHTTSPIYP